MRTYLSRIFFPGIFSVLVLPFAAAASLPDGAAIRVNAFTFPQAAYTGAEEEAKRLSAEFRNQLVAALQQAGLNVAALARAGDEKEAAEPVSEKQEKDKPATIKKKERSTEETIVNEGEDGAVDDSALEKDELMAAVEAAQRAEKEQPGQQDQEQQEDEAGKAGAKSHGKSDTYVITGTVTQYEEHVGVPVSTGKTRRSRVEVTLLCAYQVRNPAGKLIISDQTSASSARVVAETVDIHAALQNLGRKVFFEASHHIAERISGKTRVKGKADADPGSEDDEYADSPGKRLQSKSGRTKWTIN